MKIALAQLNYHIGNFDQNTIKIKLAIEKAVEQRADVVVFAELAVSGYPPRDFLEFDDFIRKCHDSILEIAKLSQGITVIVGAPSVNPEIKGKNLFNSAYVLADGKIQSVHHKTLLPNYDIFDEYRYFEPNYTFQPAVINGKKVALTICEDLWNITDDPMYRVNPMDELMAYKPELMINIAASPFHYLQAKTRDDILKRNIDKYRLPLVYVNHVGGQTDLLFDGGSACYGPDGVKAGALNYFDEDFRIFDLDQLPGKDSVQEKVVPEVSLIHDALVMGIRNYFGKLGLKNAILGLSGGIDSAVTLVLAVEALGAENCRGILLPSRFSSDHSLQDAKLLAENLGVQHDIIPIEEAFKTTVTTLKPVFNDMPFDLAEENIQARLRAVILMAISNKLGYILLNTSNKSEAAVGYGTLYGDMCGGLSVLGDLYKTQVYELAGFINRKEEIIPRNSIIKPPSAELRPDQKDSDSLPDYNILDRILHAYIEQRKGPDELISMGFEKAIVIKVLRMVNANEWKRYQTPPVLRVSPKAFGMGRRMPIAAKYLI